MIRKSHNLAELLAVLRAQRIRLPLRSQGRTKDDVERWILFRLVATLAAQGQIRFPFHAQKRERPDFDLSMAEMQIGLETTEALLFNYAQHQKLQETEFPGSFMEPGHFRRGIVPLKKQRELLASGLFTAPPYMGDAIEREWAAKITCAIWDKQKKLANPGFEQRSANWLAIKDSLPKDNDLIQAGLDRLRLLIASVWSSRPSFDRIFIDDGGPTLVSLTENVQDIVNINDLWCVESEF